MKHRIRKKRLKTPQRYKLHQYLKYAYRWVFELAYKGRLYCLLEDGRVVRMID